MWAASALASVVITARAVARLGWIIPAPFAIPPMVTVPLEASTRTAMCLRWLSVVMMALAASMPPRAFMACTAP